jgi:hypothetical protein
MGRKEEAEYRVEGERDVQCKQSFPILPLRSVCDGLSHTVSSQLLARALSPSFRLLAPGPVLSLCEPRATASRGPVLRAYLVSASNRDSVVRWAKKWARPNASAVVWPQRDEAECKCERGRIGCPEKYILAGGTSDPQGNAHECKSRARGQKRGPGKNGEKMAEAECEGLSQRITAHTA